MGSFSVINHVSCCFSYVLYLSECQIIALEPVQMELKTSKSMNSLLQLTGTICCSRKCVHHLYQLCRVTMLITLTLSIHANRQEIRLVAQYQRVLVRFSAALVLLRPVCLTTPNPWQMAAAVAPTQLIQTIITRQTQYLETRRKYLFQIAEVLLIWIMAIHLCSHRAFHHIRTKCRVSIRAHSKMNISSVESLAVEHFQYAVCASTEPHENSMLWK